MQKSIRVELLQVNTTNNSKQPQWAAIVGTSKGVEVQTTGEKKGSEWLLESLKMQMKPKSELQHKKNKTRGSGQRHEDVKLKEPKERLFALKGRVRKWPAKIAKKETAAKESWPTLGSTIPNQTVEKSIGPMWSKAIRDGDVKAVPAVKMVVKVERVTKEVTAPYVASKKAWAKVVKATEPGKTTKKEEPQQQAPKKVVHGLLGEAWKEALDVGLRGEKLMPAAPKRCHSAVAAFHYQDTNAARVDAADVKKKQRVSFCLESFLSSSTCCWRRATRPTCQMTSTSIGNGPTKKKVPSSFLLIPTGIVSGPLKRSLFFIQKTSTSIVSGPSKKKRPPFIPRISSSTWSGRMKKNT